MIKVFCIGVQVVRRAAVVALIMVVGTGAYAQSDPNLPVYTSPIDITDGRINFVAVAPDRSTGIMTQLPLPPSLLGPRLAALTNTPINLLLDANWNGTPAQQAAGTSPRQLACDAASGVNSEVTQAASDAGLSAYDVSCNFATAGNVFVKQAGNVLYLSYQLFNNSASFRMTSPVSCNPDHGTPFCPNDPRFTVEFAVEVLVLIRTPSVCSITAERPTVFLHAVQIASENAAAVAAMFKEKVFGDDGFKAAERAMQMRETIAPFSIDDNFDELRSSALCAGDDPNARVAAMFKQMETEIALPQGIIFRAIHPPIEAPQFQNVTLPSGEDTCKSGFVWREAFEGDHVCVVPETRSEAAADNARAKIRRSPTGGPYGFQTCRQGFVWRAARPDDQVCVAVETRAQTAADNAAGPSRRVLEPTSTPSFTRPSVSTQPIIAAGTAFQVTGKFFPHATDPTTLQLVVDRASNSACAGGASELEAGPVGDQPQTSQLPATPGSSSRCAYRYDVNGLRPATQYRFRIRDCDVITCSPWSSSFETLTGSVNSGPSAVKIVLDASTPLGNASTDVLGTFQATVTMPADTPVGQHTIRAASGQAADTTSVQVTAAGRASPRLMVTGSFYGDQGCPMRQAPDSIPAVREFSLFGSGFASSVVTVRLNTLSGPVLGTVQPQNDGTFCGPFTGPSYELAGSQTLVAIQDGSSRATLPVAVVVIQDPR